MKSYDIILPLGTYCAASYHLRHNNLQVESYPLDWVIIGNVKIGAEIIANDFKDFFVKERLVRKDGESGNHIPYVQKPENYSFFHCIDKDLPFDEACAKAKAMFDRRIKRLYENVGKAKNVLFLSAHNQPFKEQDAIDALDILEKKFPEKNIDLIVVDCKDNYKGVETVRINNHIDLIKMEFHTGKDIYSDKQEEFTQILSDRRLGSAWQRMGRKWNNATFKIKRFVVNTLCCLIPNKKWRKSIRRKFDVSTQMFERK